MRISTTWQYQSTVSQMLNQQSKLTDTQLKMASGKKYLTPSENPQAAVSLIDFNQRIKVYQQYQDNIVTVRQRLGQENASIDAGISIVQSIRDLAIQGMNAVNEGTNRTQIAGEIDQLKEQLFTIANTQNPNGEYIFSGYKTDQPAFTYDSATSTYTFQGDTNQRLIAIGPSREMADGDPGISSSGVSVFGAGSIGNVFQAVQKLSDDLKSNSPNSASLADLDNALDNLSSVQVTIGARLNALDVQENTNDDYIIDHKTMTSEIGDLDYAQATSDFNLQNVALQAAQQAFAKVQKLSLFNYL